MKHVFYILAASIMLAFALSLGVQPMPAQAGSCYYPVTQVSWTGYVKSGVNVRDKTCMDSTVLGTLHGGTTVTIYGEADGWYQVKTSDGALGFVWNLFVLQAGTGGGSIASHYACDWALHRPSPGQAT